MTHAMTTAAPPATDDNHMDSVRRMLIDTMRDLRNASTPEALRMETERAKSVALVAQATTGVARVELDYAHRIAGKSKLPFLEGRAKPVAPSAPTVATCWVQPAAAITHTPEGA